MKQDQSQPGTTDIADRLWESDSALTNEGGREIERLRDQSGARWAKIQSAITLLNVGCINAALRELQSAK